VVVAGAGPAGAVVALEAARRGASVLLLDRSSLPRWKVCGGCLSPGAVAVLESLGLAPLLSRLGAVPLETLVLRSRGRSARVRLRGSLALSRHAFDQALARSATEAGADWWPSSRASLGALRGDGRVVRVQRGAAEVELLAGVVVDATGLGAGLNGPGAPTTRPRARSRVGLGAVFHGATYPLGPGELHMVVGGAGYVGLVRDERGALNVAAAVDRSALRSAHPGVLVARILREGGLPELEGQPWLDWRGTPALTRSPSVMGAARLFRVGDAAGYVEPFTGEGMCWALSGARTVARLAHAGSRAWCPELLSAWQAHHRRAVAGSQRLCRTLAAGLRRPRLVAAAVSALTVAPGLAGPLVRRAARAPRSLAARAT
jgi:flavin-dependent dehydrogenase